MLPTFYKYFCGSRESLKKSDKIPMLENTSSDVTLVIIGLGYRFKNMKILGYGDNKWVYQTSVAHSSAHSSAPGFDKEEESVDQKRIFFCCIEFE